MIKLERSYRYVLKSKSTFVIILKRVVESICADYCLGDTAPKKHCIGGEVLATVFNLISPKIKLRTYVSYIQ